MEDFPNDIQNAEDLRKRLWVRQLYREYDLVVYRHRVSLKAPVIQIAEMTSRFGTWDPLMRTITLGRQLIENHSWDIVIEILKHEMAHQLVDEAFRGSPGHGRDFKDACRKLGVAPWAVSATGELPSEIPTWRDRALSEEEERLLRRMEKLLALAKSTNEHEAALAMQRVQEISRKYNLDQAGMAAEPALVYSVMSRKRKRMSRPEALIFSILGEHYFARVVHGQIFDAKDGCHYAMAELMGTRENVMMAEYVHGFLWTQIHCLWRSYQLETGATGRRKNSYLLGVLSGFREKLRQNAATTPAEVPASAQFSVMIAAADRRLDEFVRERHPRLSRSAGRTVYNDQSLFAAGKAAGKKLTLRKAVADGGPPYLRLR